MSDKPFTAPSSREDVERYIGDNDVEFLFAQFVDMHGKPNAKLVPARQLDGLLSDGAGFAGFAAGAIGQQPTTRTWRRCRTSARSPRCPGGRTWPASPATCTWRARSGPTARARSCAGSSSAPARSATSSRSASSSSTSSCASARTARSSWPTRSTRSTSPVTTCAASPATSTSCPRWPRNLTALGWNNYATDHEDANGQFEQNFDFADALTTCDRAIFFRYMVESLAQERGLIATFMPKPFAHLTGNGCHFHMSLWRDGENVFEADPADDPRGHGPLGDGLPLHRRAEGARQGLHRRDRAHGDARTSGSWWARAAARAGRPCIVSYGYNNRTQMLRIPAAGRIEDRTVDGSCNPYLGAAVMLAAGLDGIERGLDPGEPTTELNLHELTEEQRAELGVELLPANLLDATRELEQDDVLRAALGTHRTRGLRRLLREASKQQEFEEWHDQVTQWEVDRYLQLF